MTWDKKQQSIGVAIQNMVLDDGVGILIGYVVANVVVSGVGILLGYYDGNWNEIYAYLSTFAR